ncbi:unnamed protein product [Linum trigynum]|uniref:RING-type domain-containing protein n=1 Tax=Linum trigynum TaxID=586398 RepID=A0AAV2D1I3_9ROSI
MPQGYGAAEAGLQDHLTSEVDEWDGLSPTVSRTTLLIIIFSCLVITVVLYVLIKGCIFSDNHHHQDDEAAAEEGQVATAIELQSLPEQRYGDVAVAEESLGAINDGSCCICLEQLADEDLVTILHGCRHLFHHHCIRDWALEGSRQG